MKVFHWLILRASGRLEHAGNERLESLWQKGQLKLDIKGLFNDLLIALSRDDLQ